jgi:hypothetical protein
MHLASFEDRPRLLESGIRFSEPQAATLHIYHTMRGLQQAGHQVTLLALQGRQVLCTEDLQVFTNDSLPASHYAGLGTSGTTLFKRFESAVRRFQATFHLPYLALFDSYRMAEAGAIHLTGFDLIHERFNLLHSAVRGQVGASTLQKEVTPIC